MHYAGSNTIRPKTTHRKILRPDWHSSHQTVVMTSLCLTPDLKALQIIWAQCPGVQCLWA